MADQDIDFDMESTIKLSRRSRRRRDPIDDDNLDSILDSALNSASKSFPQPQPRRASSRREEEKAQQQSDELNEPQVGNHFATPKQPSQTTVGGWGEDDLSPSQFNQRQNRKESINESNIDSETSKRRVNQREINKEDDEIPEIPDLEDEVDPSEDMAFQVAEAPDVQVHQISTYKELDKEFFREKAFQFLEGNIDVSLLHCGLYTEQQIAEEEDVIWEWTKLFTDVVSAVSRTNEAEASDELAATTTSALEDTIRVRADPSIMKAKREKEIIF